MADVMKELNPTYVDQWTCETAGSNEFCYFKDLTCDKLKLPETLDIKLGSEIYSIPMVSLSESVYVRDDWPDCDIFVVPLTEDEMAVRLGDPFFASFTPVFDVDNDQIGLGLSTRAPEGSAISQTLTPQLSFD